MNDDRTTRVRDRIAGVLCFSACWQEQPHLCGDLADAVLARDPLIPALLGLAEHHKHVDIRHSFRCRMFNFTFDDRSCRCGGARARAALDAVRRAL